MDNVGVGYDAPEAPHIWRTAKHSKRDLATWTTQDAKFIMEDGQWVAAANGGNTFFGASVSFHPLRSGELAVPAPAQTEADALARPPDYDEAGEIVASYYALYRSPSAEWEGELVPQGRGVAAKEGRPVPERDHAFLQPPGGPGATTPVERLNANSARSLVMDTRIDQWHYCGVVAKLRLHGAGLLEALYRLLDEGGCDIHVVTLAHAIQYARALENLDVDIACDDMDGLLMEETPPTLGHLSLHQQADAKFFL